MNSNSLFMTLSSANALPIFTSGCFSLILYTLHQIIQHKLVCLVLDIENDNLSPANITYQQYDIVDKN